MTLKRRVSKLEEGSQAGGGFEIVGLGEFDWTEDQLEQAAAEARERVGPGGHVLLRCRLFDRRPAARKALTAEIP